MRFNCIDCRWLGVYIDSLKEFSDLDSQRLIDNDVDFDLRVIARQGERIATITLQNGVTARNIAFGLISPVLLAEGSIILATSARNFIKSTINKVVQRINRDLLLDTADLISNISGGLGREAIMSAERELLLSIRSQTFQQYIKEGVQLSKLNAHLRAAPK